MEGITSLDYRHAKRVFKNLNNKNISDHDDIFMLKAHQQISEKRCLEKYYSCD